MTNSVEFPKPDFLAWCEEYAANFGCDMDLAMRMYQMFFNPENYEPEDYED